MTLVTNVTYTHTDIISWCHTYTRNTKVKRCMPHSCHRQVKALQHGYECDICMYAHRDVTSRLNAICPITAFGRWGHNNIFITNKSSQNIFFNVDLVRKLLPSQKYFFFYMCRFKIPQRRLLLCGQLYKIGCLWAIVEYDCSSGRYIKWIHTGRIMKVLIY